MVPVINSDISIAEGFGNLAVEEIIFIQPELPGPEFRFAEYRNIHKTGIVAQREHYRVRRAESFFHAYNFSENEYSFA